MRRIALSVLMLSLVLVVGCGKDESTSGTPVGTTVANTVGPGGYTPLPNGYQLNWNGSPYGYNYNYMIQQCYYGGSCNNYLSMQCGSSYSSCSIYQNGTQLPSNYYSLNYLQGQFYLNLYNQPNNNCYYRIRPYAYLNAGIGITGGLRYYGGWYKIHPKSDKH